MPQHFYPAILYPADAEGLRGVVVPALAINASGKDADEALADAAAILQSVIDDLASAGDDIPAPGDPDAIDADGGRIVLLPASLPGKSTRVNITIDEDLLRRIDAASSNRSAFLASAARAQLAAGVSRR